MIHITRDNFVWLDVTERCEYGIKTIDEVWLGHELYAVYEDDSEQLMTNPIDIEQAIGWGARICIEVGFLPKEYQKNLETV